MEHKHLTMSLPMPFNELAFVDEDIAERFIGQSVSWIQGTPTNMQLIKELRLLRGAIESMSADISLLSEFASKER